MSILDLHIFTVSRIADSEGLSEAIQILESCLTGPDAPLDLVLQDLCTVPYLFEYIMSVWSRAEWLTLKILAAYPSTPSLLLSSFMCSLLYRLSSVTFTFPPDLCPTDSARRIGEYKIYVEAVFPVLSLLCSTDFTRVSSDANPEHAVYEDDGESFGFAFAIRNEKQNKQKRKNKNNGPTIDASPFIQMGAKVPINNTEAARLAQKITDDLKSVLKFYLELLRFPFLAEPIKDAYISTNTTKETPQPPALENFQDAIEVKDSTPSAYPMVQPIKAALYFDNAEGFGEWRILINGGATEKLRELAKSDKKTCAIVVKKIKQLSNGHFSSDNQKWLNDISGVPVFEAKMQRDLRLVYQIDVVPDHDGHVDRQVIKIYGIHTHTQLNRIWDAMGRHLAGKGREYRQRCIFRNPPLNPGGDSYLPACFPPESLQNDTKPTPLILSEEDMGELHSLLVLEKYTTFSQAFLHSLIVNQDVQHVFELSPQERKIMKCRTSCYVLGRSGTGKTTVMLFKMLGIQRAWEMQSGVPKPRQIFVTKSRVLATKVEEYFRKLLESLALAGYSLEELKHVQTKNQETGLIDVDDVPEDQIGIPRKYSALEESHFPLFVTYDKLAKMIAADVYSSEDTKGDYAARYFADIDDIDARDSCITYDIFARTYWPHFPLTKGLDPWLVFSEIIGVIKGSERSLSCPNGHLDKDTYLNLSARSNPTFANQRETVFAIFEAYCKVKKERRHHDVADRTHAILRMLMSGTSLSGQKIDFLYVDEVQDNLLIDALVLRLICRNPEGLFWAGDTAQTISAGSSFRFNDLKAFLYRIERDRKKHFIQERSVSEPEAFQLAINYRSHGGIVNCAHTVIERITCFWPDAIDRLQPEHGIINGLKPVFFRGWDQDAVGYKQFLFGESGSRIEFGAQQCILVRDEEAVEKLRKEVGAIGLIMTLYDSKGLEFNDVLLYNFFEDSDIDLSRWRALLNHVEGEVDGQDLSKLHAPSFGRDDGRFAAVCRELKLLYVGITRARKNLWIFDKSDKSEPMRMVWSARNQIQNCTPGTNVPHLAVSSTETEWASFGQELFRDKRYPQAMHCFARASMPRMVDICEAFHLREEARAKVGVAPLKVQQEAFLTAADAFMASGDDAPHQSKDSEKYHYYRNAAECYARAGDHRRAAIGYLAAQEYDLAARQYRKAGLFAQTLEVLDKHSCEIPAALSEELYTVCRLYYCSKPDGPKPSLPLFPTFEEELEFLEDYDLDFARASLLESHGKFLEAAELHLTENRPFDAIKIFLKATGVGSRDAAKRASETILSQLWHRCSFCIPSREVAADEGVVQLLALARELPDDLLDPLDHDEISMFQAIARADRAQLRNLGETFIKNGRNASALLALDHVFSQLPSLKAYKLEEMLPFLTKFRQYTRLIHQVISYPDPLSCDAIKQLFCIVEITNTEYGMRPDSFLHSSATGDRHGPMYIQASNLTLTKHNMVIALRKSLAQHLCERVIEENERCYEAVVFSQCLTFTISGQCNRTRCPSDHVNLAALDSKQYNARVAIHLQQLCILQMMYSVNPHLDRRECVLTWLEYLYGALNPEFHVQGSIANLDFSMIAGGEEGIGVMKHWVREALYGLDAAHDCQGFLTIMLKLTNLLFAFDKSGAFRCITQAPFTRHRKLLEFTYSDGRHLIDDMMALFHGNTSTSISSGVLFLRHILKFPLVVDLSVFCDCLEMIIGKIAVSWRLSSRLPLDGLVLPRSWLSSDEDFSNKKEIAVGLLLDLLGCVNHQLMWLQSNPAAVPGTYTLLHTKLTPILCNVFISRICRAICLLSYNVANYHVREKVKNILHSLRMAGPTQRAHHLYRWYTLATQNKYLRAIVDYDAHVVLEDLVQLLHKRRTTQVPLARLSRIKHVYFENPSEIPSLLAAQLVAARSDLHADAPSFIPKGVYASQMEVTEGPEDLEEDIQPDVEAEAELADEGREELDDTTAETIEPAMVRPYDPTDEEIVSAKKIQEAYRTYRRHRSKQAVAMGSGLTAQINKIFITCLKNVYAFKWRRSPYRTLYLWTLPCLVAYLDKVIAIAHKCKSETKGLFLKESHERLEELGQQRSQITALIKEGLKLQKEVDPNAAVHQRKDVETLKKDVGRVKDLFHSLPTKDLELETRLQDVYEFVMAEKNPVTEKVEKPELNTEDLDLYSWD